MKRKWLVAAMMSGCLCGREFAVDDSPPQRLSASTILERELAGGEVHPYDIELLAGDYVQVVFDQRGIDVIPVIRGPAGDVLFRNDTGEWGREEACLIAPSPGTYRLDAAPGRGDAPRGGYELRVEALRPAEPADVQRARVMDLTSQAYGAMAPSLTPTGSIPKGDLTRARELYQQTLAEWQRMGDRPGEAFALSALAYIATVSDDFRGQLLYHRKAAPIWHEVGNLYGEARSMKQIGIALDILGDSDEAAKSLEQALAIQRRIGNVNQQSLLLNDMARSRGLAGDLAGALGYAHEALLLARQLGDAALEARVMETVARVHLELGEDQICLDTCRRLLELPTSDGGFKARVTGTMGIALSRLGDTAGGVRALEEALAYWTKANYRGFQAKVLFALGDLYLEAGDLDRARSVFDLAAAKSKEIGFVGAEATSRRRLADTLIRMGRLDEAAATIRAASDLSKDDPNPQARALDMVVQARLAMAGKDLETAQRESEAALELSESVRGRAASIRVRDAMLASSQVFYETLIEVLMARHAQDPGAGFGALALEKSERARARSLLELTLAGHSPTGAAKDDLLDQMTAIQKRINAKAQALDAARRQRSEERIASLTHDIDELSDSFVVLDARMRSESKGPATVSTEPLSAASIQSKVLDEGTLLVEYFLADAASYAWVVSTGSIQAHRLAPRKVIKEAAASFQKSVGEPLSGSPERRDAREAAATRLQSLLLDPLGSIQPGKRLLIVAPAMLQQVPFAALRAPGSSQLLVDRHEVVQAPSASIVAASRVSRESRGRPKHAIAIFADPVFERIDPRVKAAPEDPPPVTAAIDAGASPVARLTRSLPAPGESSGLRRLPFSRQEAEAIAGLAPAGTVRVSTGFDASLDAVTDPSLADYGIVHFATHGLLDSRMPELSGLVFSLVDPTGAAREGHLRLHDVGRLHLNADLAVLSGCQTALGRTLEGEGVIGLTRGFMLAGARGVAASLWEVDDLATAELMKRFYRGLLVERLAAPAALQNAQRQMAASERWSDPYFWAGFVIQSDWR